LHFKKYQSSPYKPAPFLPKQFSSSLQNLDPNCMLPGQTSAVRPVFELDKGNEWKNGPRLLSPKAVPLKIRVFHLECPRGI